MQFNSFTFLIFMLIVFSLYWAINSKNPRYQNLLLLAASYIFYGWWDWRFLGLILFSSLVDFFVGLGLEHTEDKVKRKIFLGLSIITNLGLLGFFKYFNFFVHSFVGLSSRLGFEAHLSSLEIILPVGISFYTFQTMSYSIDVYRKDTPVSKDLIAFLAYVSFFPQLVAGPIERAKNLLIQFNKNRIFDYATAVDGMEMILWGLFKKTVIADNAAIYVNQIFEHHSELHPVTLMLGCIYFSFQIYGDFSGYSDIAIGLAKLLGFDLKTNFKYPYFSRDVAEFWRRWHISLTTWFKDYVYIPLGGSSGSSSNTIRNVLIVFLLSGFWHGASWKFILWGLINALYFLPLILRKTNRNNLDLVAEGRLIPSASETIQMLSTFLLISFSWIFFRAANIKVAFAYINSIVLGHNSSHAIDHLFFLPFVCLFFLCEWIFRDKTYPLQGMNKPVTRYLYYLIVTLLILNFGITTKEFIYFQF